MEKRRVVITGLGIISAVGKNRADFWSAIQEGRSGIAPIESVDMAGLAIERPGSGRMQTRTRLERF